MERHNRRYRILERETYQFKIQQEIVLMHLLINFIPLSTSFKKCYSHLIIDSHLSVACMSCYYPLYKPYKNNVVIMLCTYVCIYTDYISDN